MPNVVVPGVMLLCGVLGGEAGGIVGTCYCEIIAVGGCTLSLIGLARTKTMTTAETAR